jgi:hypothetical protein
MPDGIRSQQAGPPIEAKLNDPGSRRQVLNRSEFGIYLSALRGNTLMAEDAQRREARRQGGGNKPRRLELAPSLLSVTPPTITHISSAIVREFCYFS